MNKKITLFILNVLLCVSISVSAQQNRIQAIQNQLDKLALTVPGLNELVNSSVNGASVQEFVTTLAKSNNLSVNIDPKLNIKVVNSFNNVTASNVIVFLAKTYNLDVSFTGSIMTLSPYVDPNLNVRTAKEIRVKYNPSDHTLNMELTDDSLVTVTRKITQLSGKNIVVSSALSGKKVSAFFAGAPFETAMEKLAFANDIKMVKTSDNFYLFQALGENEETYVNGDRNTGIRKSFKPAANGPGGNLGLFVRTIGGQKLLSLDCNNAAIQDLVKSASQETGKNYFLYTDIKGTITSHIADISYDHFLSSLFQGTDYTFRIDNNGTYLIGDRKLEGLRNSRVIVLQNRSIDTVQAMIPAEWKKGVEIKEFREQNTLLLSGSGPQIADLEAYIKQLDQLVPMVMIEVTLIDVNKSRTVETGISAGVADSVKTGGTVLPGVNYTFGAGSINEFLDKLGGVTHLNLGHVIPNFYATVKALEANSNVQVHSVPKLTTLNGHVAKLSIGSKRYYSVQTQNVIGSLTPTNIVTQQFNAIEANMVINIKPVVSGNDEVTLGIVVDITDFIGTPPTNAPPPTSTSKFESIVRAHNEDMIVLGGLEREEDTDSSSGVPLLSRIPVLKWIFSNKSKTHAKIVTLVFIKPTIIH
ncbi:type II secretion system protein GspD [Mucilaginibacter sp. AW1-3]